jgi:acylphosphatase
LKKRVKIKATGKVQGVVYRYGAKDIADKLNLIGFASNESDGSVLIVAEGEEASLQKLIEWAKIGTEWAEVQKVEVKWGEATGEFKDFGVK